MRSRLCMTCVLTSSHSCAVVLWARAVYSDFLSPASRGPDLSWDSRRAFHRFPPNELDHHVPPRRGLLDHPSQCSQPLPVNTISVVTIQRASDHHVSNIFVDSALGASHTCYNFVASATSSSSAQLGRVLTSSCSFNFGTAVR